MTINKVNDTKEKIYCSAKEVFYNKGYAAATFKEIADSADVPIALITYYFKKKLLIAADIYTDLYVGAQNIVAEYRDEYNIESHLLKQILVSYIYYDVILNDEHNKRFYMELRKKNVSNYTLIAEVTQKVYAGYAREFHIPISKDNLDMILAMSSAARGGFFNYYDEHKMNMTMAEVVNTVESIVPRLMGIDHKIVDSYLMKAQRIINEIDYSRLKFLI